MFLLRHLNICCGVLCCITATSILLAQSPTGNPENRYVKQLQEWGTLSGEPLQCLENRAQSFGGGVLPVGDVNHDNVADWVLSRVRCDTSFPFSPLELLLFKGKRGSLPTAADGERIGPSELGAQTTYLASGDWDADGHRDIAVRIRIFNDTSAGNIGAGGYEVSTLVVFWGNEQGRYSLNDTTHLLCGAERWIGIDIGLHISMDIDDDGIDDLLIRSSNAGLSNGSLVRIPRLLIFRGTRYGRWGRSGIASTASWWWWNLPRSNAISSVDQDCDGIRDIVFIQQVDQGTGTISILYRQAGRLPDTNDVESIDLKLANGHRSLFTDVTGDGIPELAMNCGSEEKIKLFAGKPGQRLIQQYGTGIEPEHGRPWAEIWLPKKINDAWFNGGFSWLYDLGDANGDKLADIWTFSWPFLICYTSGEFGQDLDSLIDAELDQRDYGALGNAVCLGDIDGSGESSIALTLNGNPGTVYFFKPDDSIPSIGSYRQLPHVPGFRCALAADVDRPGHNEKNIQGQSTIELSAIPNPSSGDMLLRWHHDTRTSPRLVLTDITGNEIRRIILPSGTTETRLHTRDLAAGTYFLTLHIDTATGTTRIIVP